MKIHQRTDEFFRQCGRQCGTDILKSEKKLYDEKRSGSLPLLFAALLS